MVSLASDIRACQGNFVENWVQTEINLGRWWCSGQVLALAGVEESNHGRVSDLKAESD